VLLYDNPSELIVWLLCEVLFASGGGSLVQAIPCCIWVEAGLVWELDFATWGGGSE
jgi:hypothetical protein